MRKADVSRHHAEVLLIFGGSCREVSENKSESSTMPEIKPTEDEETSDATQVTSQSPELDRAQDEASDATQVTSLSSESNRQQKPSLKRKFKEPDTESEFETQATSLSTQSSC